MGGGGKGGSKLRIKTTFFVVGEGSHGGGWVFGGGGEKGGVFWGGGGEGVLKYTPKGGVFLTTIRNDHDDLARTTGVAESAQLTPDNNRPDGINKKILKIYKIKIIKYFF